MNVNWHFRTAWRLPERRIATSAPWMVVPHWVGAPYEIWVQDQAGEKWKLVDDSEVK